MDTNPYAPAATTVADAPLDSHGLKPRRVLVMIVFMIVSFGLYYPLWWLRRRAGLNRLNAAKKLPLWPILLLATLFAVQIGIGLAAGDTPLEQVVGDGGVLFLAMFQLGVGVVMVIQSFRVKDMIEDHATPESASGPMFVEQVQLSGLMTFFFSIFYLQWAINRYDVGEKPSV